MCCCLEAAYYSAKLITDTPIKKVEEEVNLRVIEDKGEGEIVREGGSVLMQSMLTVI